MLFATIAGLIMSWLEWAAQWWALIVLCVWYSWVRHVRDNLGPNDFVGTNDFDGDPRLQKQWWMIQRVRFDLEVVMFLLVILVGFQIYYAAK